MTNVSEELARLAKLRDDGVLSQDEFEAQKAIVLAGGKAAETPAPTKKRWGCLKPIGIGVGILLIVSVIGGIGRIRNGETTVATPDAPATTEASTEVPAPAPAIKPPTEPVIDPPIELTASQLAFAYESNEAKAQKELGDRPLMVSGTVSGVSLDMFDNPSVQLETANQFISATARLTKASQEKATELSKGQKVKLLCTDVSEVLGTPFLKGCELQ